MRIRADKLLANLGYGSRKDVAGAIRRGVFHAGGRAIRDPSAQLDTESLAGATFDHEALDPLFPLTILLHKPRGYTSSRDEEGHLITDLLPQRWYYRTPILSPAGRLDKDSTGAVLMTDDGQLLHRIISPKTHVQKHYRVTLRDALKGDETATFFSGTFCLSGDAKPLKPAFWQQEDERSGVMILQEGRYHQIRRMFASIGNRVETLHRFRIGGLNLDNLPEGAYRVLAGNEIEKLFGQA
jgi:16S rRNA pseudouridine516 synthase